MNWKGLEHRRRLGKKKYCQINGYWNSWKTKEEFLTEKNDPKIIGKLGTDRKPSRS